MKAVTKSNVKRTEHEAPPAVVDLRSDTVTQPTPEMRRAMADAEVGDDVYGEDPTINRLEARVAEKFEREAAIFVPTGSMGNQIAIHIHTQPGQEIICEGRAHVVDYEMAMAAAFSGCQLRPIKGERGVLTWEQIKAHIRTPVYDHARTTLVALENTHNMAGGTVQPQPLVEEICAQAHAAGLRVHLDGARIFNASVASGKSVAELTRPFDSVMFCLSKGLCAPVGSLLVGSRTFIDQARSVRKALGGGMRQAGILAAAGLIALEQMPARLGEDHANARFLAENLAGMRGLGVDMKTVQTNIVVINVKATGMTAVEVCAKLAEHGLLAGDISEWEVRLVTHRDVNRAGCERALEAMREVVEGKRSARAGD